MSENKELANQGKRGVGRPSNYDEEKMLGAFNLLATEGKSVEEACKAAGIPSSTFYRHLGEHPEIWENYMQARALQMEPMFEEFLTLARTPVPAGDMAAVQDKRIQLDAMKWAMGKRAPKVYGEKITHDGTVKAEVTTKMDDKQFEQIAAMLDKRGPVVIDPVDESETIGYEETE
jgi:AcrR family transcriptional regulator